MLDTRQNEALKIKGFGREIITRVQKLKKKAKINVEDAIIVFYKFGENSQYLNKAITEELKAILHAIKKPLHHYIDSYGLIDLASDVGVIDDEEYSLKICAPGPIFNQEELKVYLNLFRILSETLPSSLLRLFSAILINWCEIKSPSKLIWTTKNAYLRKENTIKSLFDHSKLIMLLLTNHIVLHHAPKISLFAQT